MKSKKWEKVHIAMIAMVSLSIGWFLYKSQTDILKNRDGMQNKIEKFVQTSYKKREFNKNDFKALSDYAEIHKYTISMGINSEDLTINKDNIPETRPLSGQEKIVVAGVSRGFGGVTFKAVDPNRMEHKFYWKGRFYVSY